MACGAGCQSGNCTSPAPAPVPNTYKALPQSTHPGRFDSGGRSGVPGMHAALMPNGRVMFLDKLENYTEVTMDSPLGGKRYAYSSEYDPETQDVVPLAYKVSPLCSTD